MSAAAIEPGGTPRNDGPAPLVAWTALSGVSLMPEGILERLTPQQLRDLFTYLESAPQP